VPEADPALVSRCRAGDPDAWDAFCHQQYDPVARFLCQLSPELSTEDVEDLCQEVFLSAVRKLDSFRGNSAVQTWLFRIALNKARDFLEKRRAAKRGGGQTLRSLDAPDPETGLTPDAPAGGVAPDEAVAMAEEGARLRAALDVLGDPCRELLELRYFGELSYEEIAGAQGIAAKAVGARLRQCLDRLAGHLVPGSGRAARPTDSV